MPETVLLPSLRRRCLSSPGARRVIGGSRPPPGYRRRGKSRAHVRAGAMARCEASPDLRRARCQARPSRSPARRRAAPKRHPAAGQPRREERPRSSAPHRALEKMRPAAARYPRSGITTISSMARPRKYFAPRGSDLRANCARTLASLVSTSDPLAGLPRPRAAPFQYRKSTLPRVLKASPRPRRAGTRAAATLH